MNQTELDLLTANVRSICDRLDTAALIELAQAILLVLILWRLW